MRQNRRWTASALLGSTFLIAAAGAGCFFGQDPPVSKSSLGNGIGGFRSECVRDVPDQARALFSGQQPDDAKIAALWDCGANALREFKTLVRATSPDAFPGTELVGFLNRYLKDGEKVSDELRVQAMKLKVAVLGGSPETLTSTEIDQTIELLGLLKRHSTALKRVFPMNGDHVSTLGEQEMDSLAGGLEAFASEVGGYVQAHGGSYAFDDAYALLTEVERIYLGPGKPGDALRWMRAEMPVLRIFKSLAAGGSSNGISKQEWRTALTTAVNLFSTILVFENRRAHNGGSWLTEKGAAKLAEVLGRGLDRLAEVATHHEGGVIPAGDVAQLVDTLTAMKLKPPEDAKAAASTVRMADLAAKALLAKQAIVGGSSDALLAIDLTRTEVLRDFIGRAQGPALRLYQIFFETDVEHLSASQFEALLRDFDASAGEAVAAIEALRRGMQPELFANFSEINRRVTPLFEAGTSAPSVDAAVRAATGARAALLGAPYQGVASNDWRPLAEQGARLLRAYLHSRHLAAGSGDGTVTPEQLQSWWALIDGGTSLLAKSLSGARPAIYLDELTSFLNGLPDSFSAKASLVALAPELFVLKQALFGGNAGSFREGDVNRLLSFLSVLKSESFALRPFFPVSQLAGWSEERVDQLAAALEGAGARLGGTLRQGSAYSFQQLDSFLARLGAVVGPGVAGKMREFVPLLGGFKGVSVGSPYAAIGAGEWGDLVSRLGSWGGIGIRIYHFMKRAPDWYQGAERDRLAALADAAIDRLREAAASRPGAARVITFADFDNLLDAVYAYTDAHDIQIPLRITTVKDVMRSGTRRLLGGANFTATGRRADGLTVDTLDLTKIRAHRWNEAQRAFEAAFVKLGGVPALASDGFDRGTLEKQLQAGSDAAGLLQAFRPLFAGSDASYSFLYDGVRENLYSFNDLSKKNIYRLIVEAFIQGYAEDPARAKLGRQATQDEIQVLVTDIHDLVADLRFSAQDQPIPALAAARFLEANTFTSTSNGDGYFDLNEGIEYMGFLGSSKALSKPIYDDAFALCPHAGVDVYGRETVEANCFRDRFFDKKLFASNLGPWLPAMTAAFGSLTGDALKRFKVNLETAARHGKYSDAPISSFDADNFVALLNYIESIFKRFDVDRQGQLKMRQALAVFPIICGKLKSVSNLPGTCKPRWGFLEALFGHFLVYGKAPTKTGTKIGDKIKDGAEFLGWMVRWAKIRHCEHCSYRVERERVLSVIEALSSGGK